MNQAPKGGEFAEIVPNSIWGDSLFTLATRQDIKSVVEIGTLDGTGSTRIILNALRRRDDWDSLIFFSIEASALAHELALKNNPDLESNFIFLHGNLLSADSPMLVVGLSPDEMRWWASDSEDRFGAPNVMRYLPEKIDLLILDGGEFSTFNDYLILRSRTRILYLDDVNARKNRLVRKVAIEDGFSVVLDYDEGKGLCILEKI